MRKNFLFSALTVMLFAACHSTTSSQAADKSGFAIHSHNDYEQDEPFWGAYNAGAASIEADIYLSDGQLMLGHDRASDKSLVEYYLDPIKDLFYKNGKKIRANGEMLQLLVDLKDTEQTLKVLEELIAKDYLECFDIKNNPSAVMIVITGDRVAPENFDKYQDFIYFDGHPEVEYTAEQLARIPMMSQYIRKYTAWKGNGKMNNQDEERLKEIISSVHQSGKKVRFWAFPDNPNAWRKSLELGIDYINTNHPADVAEYFKK